MANEGKGAVVLAVIGNGFLTVVKFLAFLLSGSGAMLSEAIHSFADTSNQLLLWIGIQRSERPATPNFPYGYGVERYLFALLSAIGIFVLGCGVTVYHGISNLLHPPQLHLSGWTFGVLALSFVIEGLVLLKALQSVNASRGKQPFWRFVRSSTDPTVLAVLFEDLVACLGVLVASLGLGLAAMTGDPMWDGLSSVVIGLMLGAVAVWLGLRNRELILGPAMPAELQQEVLDFLLAEESVKTVHELKTRVVAAGRFRLVAEIEYDSAVLAKQQLPWLRERLDAGGDPVTVAESFGAHCLDELAREVDRIEEALVARFPRLGWLDLESHWAGER
ncbi:MAG: cobalt transporter [Planctomycetes bacterium]|jgi:zinc transporter 9|nr:cobalt transporter [Planctomycetota bacterium]